MEDYDTALLAEIVKAKRQLAALRATKVARMRLQRKSGLTFEKIGEYWGTSAQYIYAILRDNS